MGEGARRVAEDVEAVVIGGGVVGCSVLLELAIRGVEAILLEAESDVGEGTSKANSAIIHTGFDAKPGTIEAGLLRQSAERWPALLEDLGVPSLACGALMVARSDDDAARLEDVAELARSHGVTVEIVDAAWLRENAPYVTDSAVGALHVPDEAIVDPFWLTRAYAEAAIALGARVLTRGAVTALRVGADAVEITAADDRSIRARHVFDCAGLWADDVARLAGDTSFSIAPRKGEFLVSERTAGVDRIVVPIPGPLGKGMLVTPIVFGGVLLGPTADDGTDKTDRSTTAGGRARILESCGGLVPAVDEMAPIRSFAGVRPVSSTGDYIIRPSTAGDRLTIVAGIRSTGISASPAIAEAAVEVAASTRGWGRRRPGLRPTVPSPELGAESGAVVCVCRSVGEAEVASALAGSTAVLTTDALKRRCGVGFGDCQGNMCAVDAIDRVATAAGLPPTAIEKAAAGSWLIAEVDPGVHPRDGGGPVDRPVGAHDVVVIGGGMAGIGAALGLVDAGVRVVIVDRHHRRGGAIGALDPSWWTDAERTAVDRLEPLIAAGRLRWLGGTTVASVEPDGDAWRVDLAAANGGATIRAGNVVLATGGYVMPREHSVIDGPRPSGVMTAALVADALDRGWTPARRAVVVGSGRVARGTAQRLRGLNVDVVEVPGTDDVSSRAVTAVRGQPRLTSVEVGEESIAADGLVLADRLQAATFLIRGLGLGDERPGVPAPAAPDGALPVRGLWAAGTCVAPDVDHARSLESGAAVARAIVTTVAAGRAGAAGVPA